MSDAKKKQNKGGGKLFRSAGEANTSKTLAECALNNWKDLRPALEVGAADATYITSMELLSNEQITVNLTITNPRTMNEEALNDVNVKRFMSYELEDLAKDRDAAMRRQNRREAPGPNVEDVDDDGAVEVANGVEGDGDDEESSDAEDVVDVVAVDADVDVEEDDPLLSQEVCDSQKILIINKRNEESKTLRKEAQKLTLDRQKLLRSFHEAFVKEKNNGLCHRRNQKCGSVARQASVIECVKQIKKLVFNLESKVSFEKESEAEAMLDNWRQKQICHVEQIVVEAKRLKEFNEDCSDLGCEEKQRNDEKGLACLCEKLSGKLQEAGDETKKKGDAINIAFSIETPET